jgi:inner membrane protein
MKLAAAAKPAVIAILALALFVPVNMIQGLVLERQARAHQAVANIAAGWGQRQTLAGPYLVVPYERTRVNIVQETVDGKPRERRTEHTESLLVRLPAEEVHWRIGAEVSEKAYGIYKARLYSAAAEARGRFVLPARFGLPADTPTTRLKLGTPRLVLGVSDPHGIRSVSPIAVATAKHAFEPGPGDGALQGGVHVPLPALLSEPRAGESRSFEFAFSLELAGSEALAVTPLGSNTAVVMRSDWPHPSFIGRFCRSSTRSTARASRPSGKSPSTPRPGPPRATSSPSPSSSPRGSISSSAAPPSTASSSSALPSPLSSSSSSCAGSPSTRSSTPWSASP